MGGEGCQPRLWLVLFAPRDARLLRLFSSQCVNCCCVWLVYANGSVLRAYVLTLTIIYTSEGFVLRQSLSTICRGRAPRPKRTLLASPGYAHMRKPGLNILHSVGGSLSRSSRLSASLYLHMYSYTYDTTCTTPNAQHKHIVIYIYYI